MKVAQNCTSCSESMGGGCFHTQTYTHTDIHTHKQTRQSDIRSRSLRPKREKYIKFYNFETKQASRINKWSTLHVFRNASKQPAPS